MKIKIKIPKKFYSIGDDNNKKRKRQVLMKLKIYSLFPMKIKINKKFYSSGDDNYE